MINITQLKKNFIKKFPNHQLAKILVNTKDELPEEEFLGAVVVWLQIMDLEKEEVIRE